ncbi:MAG: hypothetical protein HZA51_04550 [Planctomycetes bacterium]|nr:hypothetical protein [Planctomycetota bacterium]
MEKKKKKPTASSKEAKDGGEGGPGSKYPRHSLPKALRIPSAILDQNAGRSCAEVKAAEYAKVGYHGPTRLEISSAIKYGLLDRPTDGEVGLTDLAKKILRPQKPTDEVDGLREAVQKAPVLSAVYSHYRGENLPEAKFLQNALTDTFKVPASKVQEFLDVFVESLQAAKLIEERDGKSRILDVTHTSAAPTDNTKMLQKLGKEAEVSSGDSCFVIMPFAPPIGNYYSTVYEPAIRKAGLMPVRADCDIFGTGKIIDQVWRGITAAKVLVAELTTRNANVFYELGLAHALKKPVVLVSATEQDVPFDLRHIRVIYYDTSDPFWGQKLVDKVAENVLSAIKKPEEALFESVLSK